MEDNLYQLKIIPVDKSGSCSVAILAEIFQLMGKKDKTKVTFKKQSLLTIKAF